MARAALSGESPSRKRVRKATSEDVTSTGRPPAGAVSPEERERMIREAAYFRAEGRGFAGGDPEQDWIEAEREVDRNLLEPAREVRPRRSRSGSRQRAS